MTALTFDPEEGDAPPTLRSTPVPSAATTPLPRSWMASYVPSWESVKEAFRRDWSQTTTDVSPDVPPDVSTPPRSGTRPAPSSAPARCADSDRAPASSDAGADSGDVVEEDWDVIEPAMRFGFAARLHFAAHHVRMDEVEPLLRREWESESASDWERARRNVRRGWNAAGRKP